MTTLWAPGTQIVTYWGDPDEPHFAEPVTVVRDTDAELVTWLVAGTPIHHLLLSDGRDLRSFRTALSWAEKLAVMAAPRVQGHGTWRHTNALRVYRKGARWSCWCFFDSDTDEFLGWYGNIEEPHRRDGLRDLTRDCVLDVWVEPDRTVSRKDEDELELAVEAGRYTQAEADDITAVAAEIEDVVRAWGPPFGDGWETFRPDPAWPVPTFP
jgi:hypothetical protein